MAKVCYHAAARELSGIREEEVELTEELSLEAFVAVLAERHPALASHLPRMRVAINEELRPSRSTVRPDDRIDVLPPVAGGTDVLADVRDEPLSIDEVFRAVSHAGAGGVVIFTGVVRDHAEGKPVARLDYEAQTKMAIAETRRILLEQQEKHGVRLAAVHRVGELKVGDLAVVVGAAGAHRAEAFAACREALDAIKESVPIWKKEWAPDGTAHWVNLDSP